MIAIARVHAPDEDVSRLVSELEATLAAKYLPEQRHGLALDALFEPHVRFFVARAEGVAVGCGGVAFFSGYAEVKRMFVVPSGRGRGIAQALLARLETEARDAGFRVLRLETGDAQDAALRLYRSWGFADCAAFGPYARMAPHSIATSIFLEKRLDEEAEALNARISTA